VDRVKDAWLLEKLQQPPERRSLRLMEVRGRAGMLDGIRRDTAHTGLRTILINLTAAAESSVLVPLCSRQAIPLSRGFIDCAVLTIRGTIHGGGHCPGKQFVERS